MKAAMPFTSAVQCFDTKFGSRKGIRCVKTEWWGRGVLSWLSVNVEQRKKESVWGEV